jgi:hypothetical protein
MSEQDSATKSITLKAGDQFYVSTTDPDGQPTGELWTIIRTTRRTIEIEATRGTTTRRVYMRK